MAYYPFPIGALTAYTAIATIDPWTDLQGPPAVATGAIFVDTVVGVNTAGRTGIDQPVQTLDYALTRVSDGTAHQIWLKRGQTFTAPAETSFRSGANASNIGYYGAYGTGNRPIVKSSSGTGPRMFYIGNSKTDIHVHDWEFDAENKIGAAVVIVNATGGLARIRFRRCVGRNTTNDGGAVFYAGLSNVTAAETNPAQDISYDYCDVYDAGGHGWQNVGCSSVVVNRCRAYRTGNMIGAHGFTNFGVHYSVTDTNWTLVSGTIYKRSTIPTQPSGTKAIDVSPFQMAHDGGDAAANGRGRCRKVPANSQVAQQTPGVGEFGFWAGELFVNIGKSPNNVSIIWSVVDVHTTYTNCYATQTRVYQPYDFDEGAGFQADDLSRGTFIDCESDNCGGYGLVVNRSDNCIVTRLKASFCGMHGIKVIKALNTVITDPILDRNLDISKTATTGAALGRFPPAEVWIIGCIGVQVTGHTITTRPETVTDYPSVPLAPVGTYGFTMDSTSTECTQFGGTVSAREQFTQFDWLAVPRVDPGWLSLNSSIDYVNQVANIGSSAPDTTRSRARANTRWIDLTSPTNGNGLSLATAWNSFGSVTWTSNTKYLVTYTSTLTFTFSNTITTAVNITAPSVTLSVCDPVTGAEIVDQSNPFDIAIVGRWLSSTERATKFWRIRGNCTTFEPDSTPQTCAGIRTTQSDVVIRGVDIDGCQFGIFPASDATNFRAEDFICDNSYILSTAGNDFYEPGSGVRLEIGNAAASNPPSLARFWIDRAGNDGIWAGAMRNGTVSDFAIRRIGHGVTAGEDHSDGIQLETFAPNTIRRGIIDGTLVDKTLLNGGNGETRPIGACIIQSGAGQGTSGAGSVYEDLILTCNTIVLNIPTAAQDGNIYNRVLSAKVGRITSQGNIDANSVANEFGGNTGTATDCAFVYLAPTGTGALLSGATGITKTRVFELKQ